MIAEDPIFALGPVVELARVVVEPWRRESLWLGGAYWPFIGETKRQLATHGVKVPDAIEAARRLAVWAALDRGDDHPAIDALLVAFDGVARDLLRATPQWSPAERLAARALLHDRELVARDWDASDFHAAAMAVTPNDVQRDPTDSKWRGFYRVDDDTVEASRAAADAGRRLHTAAAGAADPWEELGRIAAGKH